MKFFILGPKGSGKTYIMNKIVDQFNGRIKRAISHTTRQRRAGEVPGVDCYFIPKSMITDEMRNLPMSEHHRGHHYFTTDGELTKCDNVIVATSSGTIDDIRKTYIDVKVIFINVRTSTATRRLIQHRSMSADSALNITKDMIYTGEFDNHKYADFVFNNNVENGDCKSIMNFIESHLQ